MAVGRRAAADHRARSSATTRSSARTWRGWPTTGYPGSGSAPASRTSTSRTRCARPPAEHGFPLFEVPYELPFIAITEKAFSQLVNEQYAVLRRALSAHERLERIVLSERGLEGVASGLATMIGGPALIFDARGELLARRAGRGGALEPGDHRARRRAARAHACRRPARLRAERRGLPGRCAGAAGRARAALRPRRRPAARGVADRGQGRRAADRARPADAAPGRDDRGARAAAPARRRRHRAAAGRRRADRAGRRATSTGAELARRLEPFGLRDRAGALVLAPQRGARAAAEEALARGVREEAGGGLVAASGRFLCALLPAAGDDELFALAARLHARVEREAGQSLPAGAGPHRRARRPAARLPRGALRARGAGARGQRQRRRRARRSPPTATSAPSSCCSRSRTTTRCGCSATRSWRRSRTPRAPTAAS